MFDNQELKIVREVRQCMGVYRSANDPRGGDIYCEQFVEELIDEFARVMDDEFLWGHLPKMGIDPVEWLGIVYRDRMTDLVARHVFGMSAAEAQQVIDDNMDSRGDPSRFLVAAYKEKGYLPARTPDDAEFNERLLGDFDYKRLFDDIEGLEAAVVSQHCSSIEDYAVDWYYIHIQDLADDSAEDHWQDDW